MTLPWRVKKWDGSAWVPADVKKWNGSAWVDADAWYWDGSDWVLMTDRTPDVQQYTKSWISTATQSYNGDNSKRTDVGTDIYQGYYSGSHGRQRSSIHFDSADIRSELSGATIDDVNIYLNNDHTFSGSGMTVVIGTHNMGDAPDNTYSSVSTGLTTVHFDQYEAKWFDASNTIGTQLKSGAADGITLHPPSDSSDYYGFFKGEGSARIEITYTR